MELLHEVEPARGLSGPAYVLKRSHDAGHEFGNDGATLWSMWRCVSLFPFFFFSFSRGGGLRG
jgi:hypothetical protein